MRTSKDTNTYEIGYGTHGNFHRVTLRNLESQQIILAECSCGEHLVCEHTQAALEELARDNDLDASFWYQDGAYAYLADHPEIKEFSVDAVKMLGGTEPYFLLTYTPVKIYGAPRQDFMLNDHVQSIASRGKAHRRAYSVVHINDDSTLELYLFGWPAIHNADPQKWERWLRPGEVSND